MVDSSTRAGRVYVRVTGAPGLRPGMYADVRLEAQRLTKRRIVPAAAVIERDGRPLVFVVKDGRAQWVYINPGRTNGVETEVLPDSASGVIPVAPGDQVIVSGHLTLTHDAPVRVIQADTALTIPAGGVRRPK
jgi:HlyD family secretion protein